MPKIFLSGTSGIGKTTLAQHMSELYDGMKFINGSSSVLWKEFNISSHKELLQMGINNPELGLEFQYRLLDVRKELIFDCDNFVTDRSIVDNIVYFLYQNAPYLKEKETEDYILRALNDWEQIRGKKEIWYLTRKYMTYTIENDNKRIDNKYFQDMMDNIFMMVIDKTHLKLNNELIQIDHYNFDKRISIVDKLMKNLR